MTPPGGIDFKTILWGVMVLLQYIGGSIIRSGNYSQAISSEYASLVFEFNVVFALLFLLNFVIRKFYFINDTYYRYLPRIKVYIQFQLVIDAICLLVASIYTVVALVQFFI